MVVVQPDLETKEHLLELLRKLPFRQQAAIVLRYYEDLSEHDIARALGCASGTVKSALSRGLASMKIDLERRLPEGESHE
jgi:RNA polymerase sigma factor (sigma-70 family)